MKAYEELKNEALHNVGAHIEKTPGLLPDRYTMDDLNRVVGPLYAKEFDRLFAADALISLEDCPNAQG